MTSWTRCGASWLLLLLNAASRQRLAQLGKQPVHPISSRSLDATATGRNPPYPPLQVTVEKKDRPIEPALFASPSPHTPPSYPGETPKAQAERGIIGVSCTVLPFFSRGE